MNLAEQLKDTLLNRGKTLCVAESLTGGRLQAAITSVSGASAFFDGGVTAYNLEQKVRLLGVDRAHAAACNCVSEIVAVEMARGGRERFRSDICLATTGYCEPSADQNIEQPFAFFAIDGCGQPTTGRVDGPGLDRVSMQERVVEVVLSRLLELMETKGTGAQEPA